MTQEASKDWPSILQFGTGDTITEAEVEKHYRQVAKKAHPDAGGSNEEMTQVNLAKQLALAWIDKERTKVAAQGRADALRAAFHQQYARAAQVQGQAWAQQQWASQAQNMGGLGNYASAGQSKASWLREFFRGAK